MSGSNTTDDLARRVDDPARVPVILDGRATDAFERRTIEEKAHLHGLNGPCWTVPADPGDMIGKLPHNREVVVVCAHGGSPVRSPACSLPRTASGGAPAVS